MGILTVELTWLTKGKNTLVFTKEILSANDVKDKISSKCSISPDDFYLLQNGRLINASAELAYDGTVQAVPKLLGGKGGFGSMLRAIGAQIEKTTNREACRDLSGRRLRDINEEKRLKTWIGQQAERERHEAERKHRKLEKLRAEPKHEFTDKQYEEERSQLIDKVHDAVEHGFQSLAPSTSSKPCSSSEPSTSSAGCVRSKKKPKKKTFMFEDEELDLSDSDLEKEISDIEPKVSNSEPSLKRSVDADNIEESSPSKKMKCFADESQPDISESKQLLST